MFNQIHYFTGGSNLQKKGIKFLKEFGFPEDELWLVEVQSIEKAAEFYGKDYVLHDLTVQSSEDETHIIYHHQNKYITNYAVFNPDEKESFREACKYLSERF